MTRYDKDRNDPGLDGQSSLSAYLHFGQISAQRVAKEVKKSDSPVKAKKAFLEELIVRRELSDNFCYYNKNYNKFDCLPELAKKTLDIHRHDKKAYVYSLAQLELAETHDEFWNAAQHQLIDTGKMHGYMRMYWGKKIIEWSQSPEEAFQIALYLNDKYELDSRDPNGYAGLAWCFGLRDRAWPERKIFGKIRYMNADGLKRKLDMEKYVSKFLKTKEGAR